MSLRRAQTLPVKASMGEGNTPLVEAAHAGPSPGGGTLLFKLESCNPTGSYKDRFIAAEVTRMLNSGAGACVATSSGNTGSSLAAYCARYGDTMPDSGERGCTVGKTYPDAGPWRESEFASRSLYRTLKSRHPFSKHCKDFQKTITYP